MKCRVVLLIPFVFLLGILLLSVVLLVVLVGDQVLDLVWQEVFATLILLMLT